MPLANRSPEPRRTRSGSALAPPGRILAVAALAVALSGCQTTNNGWLTALRMGNDTTLSQGPTEKEMGGKDDRNLMLRWLRPKTPPAAEVDTPNLVLGSDGWKPMKGENDPAAEAEFRAAEALFKEGKSAEAETAFARLAKKRKGTNWGEKGQFHLAETQYQRGKLVAAHDSFELLIKDYPGTEFNDKVVDREYTIAQTWLAQGDPKAPNAKKLPWYGHFNGELPLIDTQGHAIRALDHVRHHNPTGPLADDAVLRIADEYMGNRDYELAAIYYDQLIADHPKSPFLQKAQLATIDARMKGYLGPDYDGAGLEMAREVVKQTMATHPDKTADNEKLYHTLDVINDQEAERAYRVGEYYLRAGYPASAEYYFAWIPQRWPKSQWSGKAKTQLASLAKVPRVLHDPSKIMSRPGSTDPILGGSGNGGMGGMGGGMGGMGGMGGGMGGMGGMN